MNKSKLPFDINIAVKNFAGHCPMCGREAQDKRYKGMISGPILTTRRFTKRSITRECRVCGLRFSFTWIRVGKGTQIARLYRYLEDRNIPCLIVRGSGSRPASGAHTGDPLSQWWFRTNQSLKTTANLDMWQVSANRLAREFILWRDFFFPRMLRRKKAQHGVILVDRTVLSQFMILRETGVTDWNKLYPDTARSLGRKITGDMVCPDVIINLVAPKETLLSRLDSSDPKHDFRRLLIETKSHWFLDTVTMLPRRIQNKISLVGADGTVDTVFEHILDTLLSHRTISKVLQPKKVVK